MPREPAVGVILAGGLARRMGGGDKPLRPLAGRPILAHLIERLAPQVDAMALSANGDPTRFAAFGLPVLPDPVDGFPGPLAGVLAGLDWAARTTHAPWLVSVAGDAPFFPRDLVARLMAAARTARKPLACAASDGQTHPVFGLWRVALRDDLRRALVEEGVRKVDAWTQRHGVATVEFAVGAVDPFLNVNRPEDLAAAEALLRRGVAA
jgi:molybdopterin-guanine dinucleotide biosynthesis protein A